MLIKKIHNGEVQIDILHNERKDLIRIEVNPEIGTVNVDATGPIFDDVLDHLIDALVAARALLKR